MEQKFCFAIRVNYALYSEVILVVLRNKLCYSFTSLEYVFLLSRANLAIVQELGDRAAQGRACGNLGNTHYLLGNFSQAIVYHQEVSFFYFIFQA